MNGQTERQSVIDRISRDTWITLLIALWGVIYIVASFFIPFSIVLYTIFLVGLIPLLWSAPKSGLFVIIILTFLFERWFTLAPIELGGQEYKFYLLDGVLLLTTIFAAKHWLQNREYTQGITTTQWAPLWTWIFVFWGASAAIFVWSFFQNGDLFLILSGAKHTFWYALIFFVVIWTIRTKDDLRQLDTTIIVSSLAVLVFFAIGLLLGNGLWTEYQPLSTSGTRLLAQPHAFYLGFGSLYLLARLPSLEGRWHYLALTGIFVQWAGVIFSLHRHIWVALPIALVVLAVLFSRTERRAVLRETWKKMLLAVGVGLSVFLLVTLVPGNSPWEVTSAQTPLIDRVDSFGNVSEDVSANFRLVMWREAAQRYLEQPLLGIGYGQRLTLDIDGRMPVVEVRGLHNDIFALLVQGGVVLFIPFLLLIGGALWLGWNIANRAGDEQVRAVTLATVSALVLFLVASFFSTYFIINLFMVLFWMLLGMLIALHRIATHRP